MTFSARKTAALLVSVTAISALGACGPAPVADGINDPYEEQNREVHAENVNIDRTIVKPLSGAFSGGGGSAGPLRQGIGNFADNVDLPRTVVNNLLQFRLDNAVHNSARFVLNTTIGIGGLFDPAASFGLNARDSDFGETLHVWGVGEGAYLELPFVGPSTERDAAGLVVDAFLNPLSYVIPSPEKNVVTAAKLASKLGDRAKFGSSVDSVLYDSADSYAQTRIIYLENRRYELRNGVPEEDYYDPYED